MNKKVIIKIHFQVKTHLQSKAVQDIAVGYQHSHESMSHGLLSIYRTSGITGMWRGAYASVIKVMIGSAVQLTTFSFTRQYIIGKKVSSCIQDCLSPYLIWNVGVDKMQVYVGAMSFNIIARSKQLMLNWTLDEITIL